MLYLQKVYSKLPTVKRQKYIRKKILFETQTIYGYVHLILLYS
jgi:hypothetical protein